MSLQLISTGVFLSCPRDIATENVALPLQRDGKKLVVAMANPQNIRSSTKFDIACPAWVSELSSLSFQRSHAPLLKMKSRGLNRKDYVKVNEY